MPASPRTAVVTGCSTGFGRATALHLVRHGWRVVATVRRETDRARLLGDAGADASRLDVILADITNAADVSRIAAAALAHAPALDGLVNNAGTAFPAPLELLPIAEFRAQLEVNLVGHLAVTQALLPGLKAGRGTIINVSSVGGRFATPVLGAYNASKFALEALTDVLRMELAPFGVRVVSVEPASSATAIWQTSANRVSGATDHPAADWYARLLDGMRKMAAREARSGFPPERFAELVERVLRDPRPKPRYVIPASARAIVLLSRVLPTRMLDRMIRRMLNW